MSYSSKAMRFVKWRDIGHLFLLALVFPWAMLVKLFYRGFWLVCEDRNEARDNGFHFFRWVRQNRPEQRIAYAINKKSPDYSKVKGLGKIVQYGSLAHWFWYLVADKNVSSQKGGKPNAAVCYLFEVVLGLRKGNRIFLQHGVTKDEAEWLFYRNTGMRLFVTAAAPEQAFVAERFGYPAANVQLLGFSRFDALHDAEVDKDLVLVMPTWRNWLGRAGAEAEGEEFAATQYFEEWNGFLNDPRLDEMLARYGKRLLFYPHRNMQHFLGQFGSDSPRITVADWREYDIQAVLKSAALLVTDYSSVFFDFAYMRKPVLFFQFDEEQFRAKQYAQGYLDYHDTVLGRWTADRNALLEALAEELTADCPQVDESVVRTFFPLRDTGNSERIYNAIKAMR